jgi:hypothetical protein
MRDDCNLCTDPVVSAASMEACSLAICFVANPDVMTGGLRFLPLDPGRRGSHDAFRRAPRKHYELQTTWKIENPRWMQAVTPARTAGLV